MRQTFQTELRELQTQMAALGSLCADAIAKAVHAFLDDEQEVAASLSTLADTMDEKERDIENMCLRLLLKQQPVARDLRTISSALKMVTDMKRIGDQSADIAEIVRTAEPPAESRTKMYRTMALDVIHMVDESVDAFLQQDSARADAVIAYDDKVDAEFDEIKNKIIETLHAPSKNEQYVVDLLMIAKYLERIGDHAVNIAKWVKYSISGEIEIVN